MKKIIIIIFLFCFGLISAQKEIKDSILTQIQKKVELKYLLYQPKETKNQKPLIVFLHGSGERGNNLERLKIHGPFNYLKNNTLDSYVLAPLCPENKVWDSTELYTLIQSIVKKYNIDQNRIYLTGLSLGGWGTWNLLTEYPNIFAAAVPICGMVDRMPYFQSEKIKNIPIKIFHGALDDIVIPEESLKIYQRLKSINAKDVHLTIFENANHNSWSQVYDNSEIYEWMLKQLKVKN